MHVLLMLSTLLIAQGGEIVKLPAIKFTNVSIEESLQKRRSVRSFKDKGLTLQEISNILWAAQGITDRANELRSAPSAGATYPLEVFVAKKDGFFRYIPVSHSLREEKNKDLRAEIAKAALGQMFIADAGLVVIITAIFDRTTARYGERGVRYVYNEVGHCAENIHLEAVALGLGSVPVGAFDDEKLKKVLGLDEEEPLYVVPVGHPK